MTQDLLPADFPQTSSPSPAPVELDALAQWRRVSRALAHWRLHQEEWAQAEPAWPQSFLQEEAALEQGAALDRESARVDG